MKLAGFIWAGVALFVFASTCNYAAAESSESRPLDPFDKIYIKGGANAEVVCGSPAHAVVEVSGLSVGIQRIKTEVEDHTLTISTRGIGIFIGSSNVVVTTPTPVKAIKAGSGGSLEIHSCAISPASLDLSASAGASIRLGGTPHQINAEASSGATIGPLDDEDIGAEGAEIEVSSGASIRLCEVKWAKGKASSGGSVRLAENTNADFEVSSGGSIRKRGCH